MTHRIIQKTGHNGRKMFKSCSRFINDGAFMAAGIVPAYDAFAEEYNITIPTASYLSSVQVCVVAMILVV